ncbi:MAG: NAD(P)/FAD-dependent oxidoreductase [Candidatus Lokiarchaeota archaeon]|nr:NAD(P)/FAD-dependent oxidoreductase [Candidatus Lokiarchaeota archaeon]
MYNYKYLIIGGGMTADAAVRGIREHDPNGTIGLISSEEYAPYARPPLSKSLWKGEETVEDIDLNTAEVELEMHLGQVVKKIDLAKKIVYDEKGNKYNYEKVLMATGGIPKRLPNIEEAGIIYYRTLSDYKKLKDLVNKNKTFGVIGGGFIGSEIAAAIKIYKPDSKITMIFLETGIGALIFPKKLSNFLNNYYQKKGIEIAAGEMVKSIVKQEKGYVVETKSGKKFKFDVIIAGLGINPNTELIKGTNIKIDNGIIVNKFLQTNDIDVFAAGDVAIYYNTALNKLIRVEHEDNAISMGEIAGQNMAGANLPYDHISYFYSDLFDLGYEAVGILDSNLEIVEDWKEPFEEGVIYYLKEGKIQGVLLWNVWEKTDEARGLIAKAGPFSPKNLKDRI